MFPPFSFTRLAFGLAVILCVQDAQAALKLSDLFADHMVVQRDRPIPVWGHAVPNAKINIELAGLKTSAAVNGDGEWSAQLPALPAGGPHELKVSGDGEITLKDVLIGDVWLSSGQSNLTMRMFPNPPWSEGVLDYEKELAAANDPSLRFFTVIVEGSHKPQTETFGSWLTCTPEYARYFSAVTYYFVQSLRKNTGIPIGVIVSARGATSIKSWLPRETLEQFPEIKDKLPAFDRQIESSSDKIKASVEKLPAYREKYKQAIITDGKVPSFPDPFPNYDNRPGYLYNAMIAPLTRVPVRGFIWWQGESDAQIAKDYAALFKALILSRRAQWNAPDAPFLFVQIANYDPVKARNLDPAKFDNTWAEQRAAQAQALELPHTAMAVAADAGDTLKVHPRDKKTVGERLGRAALAMVYGKDIPFRGPRIESVIRKDREAVLSFIVEKGSLTGKTAELTGFELASDDGIYQLAQARLDGTRVIVSSASVANPTQVRYAWANDPTLSLYDSNGLPAPPFQKAVEAK